MKSRVYRGGKPEGRHQLVEVTEGAVGIGKELQWQTSMANGLAACIQARVDISNMCHNPRTLMFL